MKKVFTGHLPVSGPPYGDHFLACCACLKRLVRKIQLRFWHFCDLRMEQHLFSSSLFFGGLNKIPAKTILKELNNKTIIKCDGNSPCKNNTNIHDEFTQSTVCPLCFCVCFFLGGMFLHHKMELDVVRCIPLDGNLKGSWGHFELLRRRLFVQPCYFLGEVALGHWGRDTLNFYMTFLKWSS